MITVNCIHNKDQGYMSGAMGGIASGFVTAAFLTVSTHYQRDRKSRKIISLKITRLLEHVELLNNTDVLLDTFCKINDEVCEQSQNLAYKGIYNNIAKKLNEIIHLMRDRKDTNALKAKIDELKHEKDNLI